MFKLIWQGTDVNWLGSNGMFKASISTWLWTDVMALFRNIFEQIIHLSKFGYLGTLWISLYEMDCDPTQWVTSWPLQYEVPKGSILSPCLLTSIWNHWWEIWGFGVGCHQYADGTQLILYAIPLWINWKSWGLNPVRDWMQANKLKLNPKKQFSLSRNFKSDSSSC